MAIVGNQDEKVREMIELALEQIGGTGQRFVLSPHRGIH